MTLTSRLRLRFIATATALVAASVTAWSPAHAEEKITAFIAVSLTNAMTDIIKLYEEKTGTKVVASFGATSTLAKQIEAGAPADVYISADEPWINYLDERKLIDPASRKVIFGNSLSLITTADNPIEMTIAPGFPLLDALKGGKLAVGDPDHTAVGVYAKEALMKLGVWNDVEPHLARAPSVRAGLTMIERKEVPLGIAFTTEGKISDKVRIVGVFPEDTHAPIKYPLAITSNTSSRAATENFVSFLESPEAIAVYERFGFLIFKK